MSKARKPESKKARSRRRITHRAPSPASLRLFNQTADQLLEHAEAVFALASGLDTAVRDSVAEGLSHVVFAAYDCRAIAKQLQGDEWNSFCSGAAAEWFRKHGFVEWFCQAAACGFRADPPRQLQHHVVRRVKAK